MVNIFENAYFGKPYKTRDNRKAIFIGKFEDGDPFTLRYPYVFHVENTRPDSIIYYNSEGNTENINAASIVPEWQEEISEEFEKYADFASDNFWSDEMETFDGNPLEEEIYYVCQRCYHAGLKDGYRKSKEK